MTRRDVILMLLAATDGKPLPFFHIQKMIYALHRNHLAWFSGDETRYRDLYSPITGPFSRQVYADLAVLRREGRIEVIRTDWPRRCLATAKGAADGQARLAAIDPHIAKDIRDCSAFLVLRSMNEVYGFTEDTFFIQ